MREPSGFFARIVYRLRVPLYVLIFLLSVFLTEQDGETILSVLSLSAPVASKVSSVLFPLVFLFGVYIRIVASFYLAPGRVSSGEIDSSSIVRSGPYRFVSHPVYLGSLIMFFSISPFFSFRASIFFCLASWLLTFALSSMEERAMGGRVAERRFIPKAGFLSFLFREGASMSRQEWFSLGLAEYWNLIAGFSFLFESCFSPEVSLFMGSVVAGSLILHDFNDKGRLHVRE